MAITVQVKFSDLHADPTFNCRGEIHHTEVMDLVDSIKKDGLIQPLVAMPHPTDIENPDECEYLLVAGHRRHKALEVIHLLDKQNLEVDCIIREDMDTTRARIINLTENLVREQLNLMQEARAIKPLFDVGMTENQTAKELHQSRGWVQTRFQALSMPQAIQDEIEAGILNQDQIKLLYSIPDYDERIRVAKKIKIGVQKGDKMITARCMPKKKADKRIRKKPEIFVMMEHIQENIGNGVHTRCLAWTAGEISDAELFADIKEFAIMSDQEYTIPADGDY